MTTRLSKCINAVLKGTMYLPISAIVRCTYERLQQLFVRKKRCAASDVRRITMCCMAQGMGDGALIPWQVESVGLWTPPLHKYSDQDVVKDKVAELHCITNPTSLRVSSPSHSPASRRSFRFVAGISTSRGLSWATRRRRQRRRSSSSGFGSSPSPSHRGPSWGRRVLRPSSSSGFESSPSPSLRGPLIFWAFSIYLEAVAILPQLVLLQPSGNVDNLTG
ncbi:hypothetical protein AHAS_Ahas19G0077700 [Arachis hypogaea]